MASFMSFLSSAKSKDDKELRARKVSQSVQLCKSVQMKCRQQFAQELSWSRTFSPDFSELPGYVAIFHGFLSINLVSYCQIACLFQRTQGLSRCIHSHLCQLVWWPGFLCWCATQRKFQCSFRFLLYKCNVFFSYMKIKFQMSTPSM